MTSEMHYLKHSSGIQIPYFIQNDITWISGSEVARLLNYAKPHGALRRNISPTNQKKFIDLNIGVRVPGIQPQRIFITFQGLQELLQKNSSHPLATDWATLDHFLNTGNSVKALPVTSSNLPSNERVRPFEKLSEIPETASLSLPAQGYVYLLDWNGLGKVGKTRSLPNRKQSLQQRFKDAELTWFCFCHNMDLLEREILQKLAQLGALVKEEGSVELFDPNIISFKEVQDEILRLAEKINRQYQEENERIRLKQEYTKVAGSVIELLNNLSKEYPKETLELVEPVLEHVFPVFREL